MKKASFLLLLSFLFATYSCQKEANYISDNEPTSSFNISDLKIENYVNRVFIDIVGREPLDTELEAEVEILKIGDLRRGVRDTLIRKLMNDTTFSPNEGSYRAAYVQNLYNLAKVRCLENSLDSDIRSDMNILRNGAYRDSLVGNLDGYYKKLYKVSMYQAIFDSHRLLFEGLIEYHEMFSAMVNNGRYDQINMNSFNFIRAVFDQLLWRLPTAEEYEQAYNMVEFSRPGILFAESGESKNDFVDIVIESNGMLEGMIIWAYQSLLNRPPTSEEVTTLMINYSQEKKIDYVIAEILATDEYANFE